MKLRTKLIVIAGAATAVSLSSAGLAMATPSLPSEQQNLIKAGFSKTASWAKFDKQDGSCHITVELSGKNYYVRTTGKLSATLYPVLPGHVVDGATFMDTNCQG